MWQSFSVPVSLDSQTCHIAILDSRSRHFHLVSATKAQCELPFQLHYRNLLTYLKDYRMHSDQSANF